MAFDELLPRNTGGTYEEALGEIVLAVFNRFEVDPDYRALVLDEIRQEFRDE
jgi:hypothetical protein